MSVLMGGRHCRWKSSKKIYQGHLAIKEKSHHQTTHTRCVDHVKTRRKKNEECTSSHRFVLFCWGVCVCHICTCDLRGCLQRIGCCGCALKSYEGFWRFEKIRFCRLNSELCGKMQRFKVKVLYDVWQNCTFFFCFCLIYLYWAPGLRICNGHKIEYGNERTQEKDDVRLRSTTTTIFENKQWRGIAISDLTATTTLADTVELSSFWL